jgi:hypothetical protein
MENLRIPELVPTIFQTDAHIFLLTGAGTKGV